MQPALKFICDAGVSFSVKNIVMMCPHLSFLKNSPKCVLPTVFCSSPTILIVNRGGGNDWIIVVSSLYHNLNQVLLQLFMYSLIGLPAVETTTSYLYMRCLHYLGFTAQIRAA